MALPHRLTRRQALQAGGAGALALGLGACNDDLEPQISHDPDSPNTVLIVTDSTRLDFVSAYPGAVTDGLANTPNLEALARDSLLFDHAVPDAMPTGSVRRALITGMRSFPFRNWTVTPHLPPEPGWNDVYPYQPMFTEVMTEAGVETAYVTDNPFLIGPRFANFRRTLDMARPDYSQASYRDFNRPFKRPAERSAIERYLFPKLSDSVEVQRLREYVGWNNLYRRRESDYAAARVIRGAIDVLDELKDSGKPFFLGVDAFDPHEAFDPPRVYMNNFERIKGSEKDGIIPIQPFDTPYSRYYELDIDDETLERIRELYSAELTFVDRWIGRLLNKMDDLGMLDNTAVMYLSDHGVNLGEYGILGKSPAYPNWPIYRVPYMIRHPEGKLAGQTSGYYASTHDPASTLLGFMGIRKPGLMDGEDLSRFFDGKDPYDDRRYFTSCYSRYLICGDEKWVLIAHSEDRRIRLFDRENDPMETNNVYNENRDVADRLWRVLEQEAGGTLPQFGDDFVMGG